MRGDATAAPLHTEEQKMSHIYSALRHEGHSALAAAFLTAVAATVAYVNHP